MPEPTIEGLTLDQLATAIRENSEFHELERRAFQRLLDAPEQLVGALNRIQTLEQVNTFLAKQNPEPSEARKQIEDLRDRLATHQDMHNETMKHLRDELSLAEAKIWDLTQKVHRYERTERENFVDRPDWMSRTFK